LAVVTHHKHYCTTSIHWCSNYSDFLKRHLHLRNRLLDHGYKKIRLIRSLKKFIFRYQDLVEIYSVPNLPLSLRLKVSGCHYNSIYNNTWTKQVKQLSNQCQTQWSKCQKHRHLHLRNRLLDQGYKKIRLIRSLKKFIFQYQDLVEIYSVSAEKIINDGFSYSENV
jgi:hypothetical protein